MTFKKSMIADCKSWCERFETWIIRSHQNQYWKIVSSLLVKWKVLHTSMSHHEAYWMGCELRPFAGRWCIPWISSWPVAFPSLMARSRWGWVTHAVEVLARLGHSASSTIKLRNMGFRQHLTTWRLCIWFLLMIGIATTCRSLVGGFTICLLCEAAALAFADVSAAVALLAAPTGSRFVAGAGPSLLTMKILWSHWGVTLSIWKPHIKFAVL